MPLVVANIIACYETSDYQDIVAVYQANILQSTKTIKDTRKKRVAKFNGLILLAGVAGISALIIKNMNRK